jgi:threonine/homoserine/homoserine lactone efflux protein
MDPQPLAFGALLAATFVTAVLPGPCAIMAAGRSARSGPRSGLLITLGVLIGYSMLFVAAIILILGALALPDMVFRAMKWLGVIVLIVLAVGMLRPAHPCDEHETLSACKDDFVIGLVLALPNPHALVFVLALLPQFVQPGGSIGPAVVAGAVFMSGATATMLGATAFGASMRLFARHRRWIDYAGAATLVTFAAAAVLSPSG